MKMVEVLAEAFVSPMGLHITRVEFISHDGSLCFNVLLEPKELLRIAALLQDCATKACQREAMDSTHADAPTN